MPSRYIRICLQDKVELIADWNSFLCPACNKSYEEEGDIFGVWDNFRNRLIFIADVESGWLAIQGEDHSDNLLKQLKGMITEYDRIITAGVEKYYPDESKTKDYNLDNPRDE